MDITFLKRKVTTNYISGCGGEITVVIYP